MQGEGTTSVFTDDSGTRERLITWTVRSVIGLIVIAVLAVGFSLATGVPLPTPVGPLRLPGSSAPHHSTGVIDQAGPQAPAGPAAVNPPTAHDRLATGPTASPTQGPGSIQPGRSTSGPTSTTTPPVPSPTKTTAAKANHGVAATKAPRATPTHVPGGPAPTPPGRAK
ncbi:MAG: hypothetical protein JWO79_4340 [Actinomycetia bacterium]|nr:hypothetical protein [Actinomycetes bacterium]